MARSAGARNHVGQELASRGGIDFLESALEDADSGRRMFFPDRVSQGRVYLTTAYEGTQPHAWDRPAFWATIVLACGVAGLALTQIPRVWRSFRPTTTS